MNMESNENVRLLKMILKRIDIISILITVYQFFVSHDYSIGTIIGMLSVLITVTILILEDISKWRNYIISIFGTIKSNKLEKFLLIFNICYVGFNVISLILLMLYYDGTWFGIFIIYGSPVLFSILIIVIKIINDNLKKIYLIMYQLACSSTFVAIGVYVISETIRLGFSLSALGYIFGAIIMYIPIFYVTKSVARVCCDKWN